MMRSPFFSDSPTFSDTFDRLVNETLGGSLFKPLWSRNGAGSTIAQAMPLDVYATDNEAVVIAAVPGMRPDDLDVSVHQDTVTISGKIGSLTESEETQGATWYLHELPSGDYHRSVTLPFPIDADAVDASFANGIVRVVLPKMEQAKPRKIALNHRQPEAVTAGSTREEQG